MGRAALGRVALAGALALVASACTGADSQRQRPVAAQNTSRARTACPANAFGLRPATAKPFTQAASVVHGHVPGQLPHGFRLAQVTAVQPHDSGYVAWTDSACRRVSVFFEPGVTTVSGGMHAFGPWVRLQNCGTPRPCLVYQGAVGGGLVTFATWRLDRDTATAVLRSIRA